MTERLYIIRHGFRLNWITSSWTSPTGLARDPGLAAHGEAQADEVAQYFLSLAEHERPTAIFSSPYYRCLQTASPTAKALGLPIFVEHGFSEYYSPVIPGTGFHPRPDGPQRLKAYFPEIDPSWTTLYYPPRKGESVEELHERINSCLSAFSTALAERLPKEARKRVVLFSHAAPVIALVRAFIGDPGLNIRVGCCSISELVRKKGGNPTGALGEYEPVKLVSGAHLSKGSDREWGFDDIEIDKGKVVEDPGVPGSEEEKDEAVGLQIVSSRLNCSL